MKKILFLAIIGCFCLSQLHAQTEKGSLLFGFTTSTNSSTAGFGFSSNNQNENKEFNLNISPNIGTFVTDNFLIGGTLGFNYSRTKNDDANFKSTLTAIQIGPLLRYYFGEDKLKPFINFNPTFATGNTSTDFSGSESDQGFSGYAILANAGVAYFINEKLSIDISLGVNFTSTKAEDDDDRFNNTLIGLTVGFSFFK